MSIKSIDTSSVHRITSGQVLVDLQTAVKELVENSLDAGANNIEVRFNDYGLKSFEVADNGSGISADDYEHVGLKHYTSKLSTFEDLSIVQTFGFRGEALSSLCTLTEQVTVTTATAREAPMGTVLELDRVGKLISSSKKTARQRGTTILAEGLFKPLPVRRKEFERNSKREFGKALNLLTAYALVPCTKENKGVRLSVVHQQGNRKTSQLRTDGRASLKASISSLWGPKQLDSLTELNLTLLVLPERAALRRSGAKDIVDPTKVHVRGLISKFSHGSGRTSSDRQYFFINGRPCAPAKIQKAFNEVYRTFNATQSPFVVADFILPTDACDINVSPDKRTILLHSENALVIALKEALEESFSLTRSTLLVQPNLALLDSQQKDNLEGQAQIRGSVSPYVHPVLTSPSKEAVTATDSGERSGEEGLSEDTCGVQSVISSPNDPSPPSNDLQELQILSIKPDASNSVEVHAGEKSSNKAEVLDGRSENIHPAATTSSTPKPPGPKSSNRTVQMVLSTANASWSMQPAEEEPPRKKPRLDIGAGRSRSTFRSQLSSFAAAGSQRMVDTDSLEEVEGVHDNHQDDRQTEEDDFDQVELDELEIDPEAGKEIIPEPQPESHQMITRESAVLVEDNGSPLFLPDVGAFDDSTSEMIQNPSSKSSGEHPVEHISEEQRTNLHELEGSSIVSSNASSVERTEVRRTNSATRDMNISCDIQRISFVWDVIKDEAHSNPSTQQHAQKPSEVNASASILNVSDEQSAESELSRIINKSDFAGMDVIGQFNRGFIIARRRTYSSHEAQNYLCVADDLDDLFIIDQHAADEKYNFETLQQTTKIDSQKLFKPRPLELTAADELLALDNIDVLRSNGFELIIDEEAESSQGRINLIAQPVSGNTIFDMKDLEELLHLMQDRPAGQKMVRCSKVRAMFAMRACRKSVMIGMPLTETQMTSVVRHMGTMDQPWNCPHGRPTMRHLVDLRDTVSTLCFSSSTSRAINWSYL